MVPPSAIHQVEARKGEVAINKHNIIFNIGPIDTWLLMRIRNNAERHQPFNANTCKPQTPADTYLHTGRYGLQTHRFSVCFSPTRFATWSRVNFNVSFGTFGNLQFPH